MNSSANIIGTRSSDTVYRCYVTMLAHDFTLQGFPHSRFKGSLHFSRDATKTLRTPVVDLSPFVLSLRISRTLFVMCASRNYLKVQTMSWHGIDPQFLCPFCLHGGWTVIASHHSFLSSSLFTLNESHSSPKPRTQGRVWFPTHTSMRPWCSPGRAWSPLTLVGPFSE